MIVRIVRPARASNLTAAWSGAAPIASTGATPNNYLYSGEQFDPNLSLYNLRARYYNALTGRFETMDPLPQNSCCGSRSTFDPSTLHAYVYAQNNPVNRIDPQGTDSFDEEGEILGANFRRFIVRFQKWGDPAARARICAAAVALRSAELGYDPEAMWAAYLLCILEHSAPFN
jgi:RHS repeat-associated protein